MLSTIRLSPLGSPIIRRYNKPFIAFKWRRMYPNVSKWNAKKCVCCTHLCTKTTITISVNGRQFSIINNNDMDWASSDLIYVIAWTEINCGMQYVGQTGWSLRTRLCEHFGKMKKPKKIDTFLYRHFKSNGNCLVKLLFSRLKNYIWSKFIK